MKLGFDHDKYTRMQSERIMQRIDEFGGKLYLELGGKLFDDFHASRVLPGFKPASIPFAVLSVNPLSLVRCTVPSRPGSTFTSSFPFTAVCSGM